jgi:hypothetical protein
MLLELEKSRGKDTWASLLKQYEGTRSIQGIAANTKSQEMLKKTRIMAITSDSKVCCRFKTSMGMASRDFGVMEIK